MKTLLNLPRSVCLPALALAVGLLSACGQKGPLTLPKDAAKPASAPAATPAMSPASAPPIR